MCLWLTTMQVLWSFWGTRVPCCWKKQHPSTLSTEYANGHWFEYACAELWKKSEYTHTTDCWWKFDLGTYAPQTVEALIWVHLYHRLLGKKKKEKNWPGYTGTAVCAVKKLIFSEWIQLRVCVNSVAVVIIYFVKIQIYCCITINSVMIRCYEQ